MRQTRVVLAAAHLDHDPANMTQTFLGGALSTLGERESGTARLEQAVAAWDACLTVTTSVWPSEWIQDMRALRDEAQSEIKRRSLK